MEQYMTMTRTDYGSGVARPKIDNKDQFELKGQFLKELQENTFSGSDNEDVNEHIEKVLEIVDLFHVPNITVDQLMLRVFLISLTGAISRTARKIEECNNFQQKPVGNSFFKHGKVQFPDDSEDAKKGHQEWQNTSQKWHNGNTRGRKKGFEKAIPSSTETNPRDQSKLISTTTEADSHPIRHIGSPQYAVSDGQNSKLVYKSRQTTVPFLSRLDNHYCEEEEEGVYGPILLKSIELPTQSIHTIPRKEKDPGIFTLPCFINNVCFDNALVDLGASISVMPLLTYLNLGLGELAHTRLTVELADRTVKYPKGIAEKVLVGIGKFTFPMDFIILNMPEDIKVPLILERPFLSTARSKIDVFKARLYGIDLVLNRLLDHFLEDYIELNALNEPVKLRRNQGDDLMPTIEEGEVIEEFRTRDEDT
ncbi:putative ribonuclease H-like domain-containing protein [Tanacetum coccineum]|uniref:Ribonuclease H-like domain-containing protein n=1 Tax=Tanacetum coccineum TaxID=301880 RepID=A0ABQ5IIP6_9ASTR